MSSISKVANSFRSLSQLESIIFQLESNLGQAHQESPFKSLKGIKQVIQPVSSSSPSPISSAAVANNNSKPEEVQREKTPPKQQKPKDTEPKQENKPGQKPEEKKEQSPIEEFAELDIRVGRIIECWKHPESDNLWCEQIDVGYEIREIASGLQQVFKLEEMTGLVLVFANLQPKRLGGFMSNGMVLCSNIDQKEFDFLRPPSDAKPGDRVYLEGHESLFPGNVQEILNPKKSPWEKIQPTIKTNTEGNPQFNGLKWRVQSGLIKTKLINAHVD